MKSDLLGFKLCFPTKGKIKIELEKLHKWWTKECEKNDHIQNQVDKAKEKLRQIRMQS